MEQFTDVRGTLRFHTSLPLLFVLLMLLLLPVLSLL